VDRRHARAHAQRLQAAAGARSISARCSSISSIDSSTGSELNPGYVDDAVRHLRAADEKRSIPTLFDQVEEDAA
jgi:hypothetical protein